MATDLGQILHDILINVGSLEAIEVLGVEGNSLILWDV